MMRLSRRSVLGTGAALLAAGAAGCVGGSSRFTQLSASVREPFEADPPATVPVTVDAYVENVDSDVVAIEGAAVTCYDADRVRQTEQHLGDFAWRDADPEQRQVEERDGFLTSSTVYSASWTVETELEVQTVPEWITFDVESVRIGDDDEERSGVAPVGRARATQPPPLFTANIQAYEGDRPAPSSVRPAAYQSLRLTTNGEIAIGGPEPILPRTPTPTERENSTADGTLTTNETLTANGTSTASRTPSSTANESDH